MGELLKVYREERARLGLSGPGRAIGGHFWLIVSKDPKATLAELGPHVMYQIEMYNKWLGEAGQALFPPISSPAQLVEMGILQILTPHPTAEPHEVPNHGVSKGFRVHRVAANRWELVRTDDGWKIKRRTVRTLDGTEPAREVLRGALAGFVGK